MSKCFECAEKDQKIHDLLEITKMDEVWSTTLHNKMMMEDFRRKLNMMMEENTKNAVLIACICTAQHSFIARVVFLFTGKIKGFHE